jgi:hypothetical protein
MRVDQVIVVGKFVKNRKVKLNLGSVKFVIVSISGHPPTSSLTRFRRCNPTLLEMQYRTHEGDDCRHNIVGNLTGKTEKIRR